jgi:hypothetical protein
LYVISPPEADRESFLKKDAGQAGITETGIFGTEFAINKVKV